MTRTGIVEVLHRCWDDLCLGVSQGYSLDILEDAESMRARSPSSYCPAPAVLALAAEHALSYAKWEYEMVPAIADAIEREFDADDIDARLVRAIGRTQIRKAAFSHAQADLALGLGDFRHRVMDDAFYDCLEQTARERSALAKTDSSRELATPESAAEVAKRLASREAGPSLVSCERRTRA